MTVVCVTGATGFVASAVVKALDAKGYEIRGTVRSLTSEYAKELAALFPKVQLFEADLLDATSFDAAFNGVEVVLHTASPFRTSVEDPQRDLLDPAVKGTQHVMQAALKNKVRRVVVTSSCAAVGPQQTPEGKAKQGVGYVLTEADWVSDATIENAPYRLSKVLAEQAAWEFVKQHPEMELVALNPSFVLGPPVLSHARGVSLSLMSGWLSGTTAKTPASAFGVVDVRDLANAHVAAVEKSEANGSRFICSSSSGIPPIEYARILAAHPDLKGFPFPQESEGEPAYVPHYNHSHAESVLAISFRPLEETVVDMAKRMIEAKMYDAKTEA